MKKIYVFLLILSYANFAHADYITGNIINGCLENDIYALNNQSYVYAVFERNQYNCPMGYYLPANATGCETCLSGYKCFGGTYIFNEYNDQGLQFDAFIDENVVNGCDAYLVGRGILTADFTPNEYTCSGGYYLPADAIECVACPADSYCAGGTYTFNETVTQGIESCPNNWYSPTGSSSVAQCGRILHVGDSVVYLRSVKQTTPSLNVQIGDDIFYANMTTTQTKMNKDSNHYFRSQWDNNDYYICDDTTYVAPVEN